MFAVVGGIKGGAGKTIVATNLAVLRAAAGQEVLLVDGDDQESTTLWSATRSEVLGERNRITAVQLTGRGTRDELQRLASKYDDIIIDVGGRDTGSLRAALTVADSLLVPVQPRSFDILAVEKMAELVKEAREVNDQIRAIAVLNAADAQGSDNDDAAAALAEIEGITYLPCVIVRRKAFPNAAATGRAVIEHQPKDAKAIEEITALAAALFV